MIISSQLLQEIADPTLTREKRALLRCQLAKGLEDVGNYEAAREAMGELWPKVGGRPVLDELSEATAADVLLRVGVLTGWLGSTRQIEGAQETAKNLISESITRFGALQNTEKVAEGQMELGHCYWREGSFNEARVWLKEALDKLPETTGDLKAITLLRLSTVERASKRFHDALQIHIEAAPLFDKSTSHANKGKFHNQYGFILRNLGTVEGRPDYIDQALIEYAAASFHFEHAGHTRYQACVENNLGFLFHSIKKFAEAHEHLDRAQALFTSMKDAVHTAQVDDTRARVLLAEGRTAEAEKLVRSAVQVLERGGQQSLLAEALTTHGIILARMGSHKIARLTLQRAVEVAQNAGDLEAAGLAALIILEELSDSLPAQDLSATYDRAAELLSRSGSQEHKDRLLEASRRVLFLVGVLPTPPTWKGFNFYDAVLRYEARIIERALKQAGGIVSRAAELLGLSRQSLDSMLKGSGRHTALAQMRAPAERQPRSLMFRGDEDCPETRAVVVLHIEDDSVIAEGVSLTLEGEGWSVETCATGAAALEKLESSERFDVLIFDNVLPDTTGIELIRRTRALAHRQQTPIIMLSGSEVEIEARRAGANKFLRKPGDVGAIPETVARLLARKKGRES
ncbi:MAG: two-component system, OmpR family, response regulator QseB [Acidobacteriota bacterium]|jgi:CheY-like chemotaxis protein|nr:two-component system, OmpR family, response regulator QseB [Acidobacteriota bacterium]